MGSFVDDKDIPAFLEKHSAAPGEISIGTTSVSMEKNCRRLIFLTLVPSAAETKGIIGYDGDFFILSLHQGRNHFHSFILEFLILLVIRHYSWVFFLSWCKDHFVENESEDNNYK